MELKKGSRVFLEDMRPVKVTKQLGSGGQGAVYQALCGEEKRALKWYFARRLRNREKFRENLRQNILDGAPSGHFLWPLAMVSDRGGDFGYLMDLRPRGFADFSDVLNNRAAFKSLDAAVLCALNIVAGFKALHRAGKSYQDLNDGNFFVNPATGAVLICDNDNVAPDGENLGIGGKPGYMAPEVVRGQAKPGTLTDQHSLAVVLFKLFMRHDPLMGRAFVQSVCITEAAERRLYGDSPVFIFDPCDASNRPVPGIHANPLRLWPLFPPYIRQAFERSFCRGMKDPAARLTEHEWQKLLVRLRGEILSCGCGAQFFAAQVRAEVKNGMFACPGCGAPQAFPALLRIKDMPVHLGAGSRLYACHTDMDSGDFASETGRVLGKGGAGSPLRLRNTSQEPWLRADPGGPPVRPGGSCVIRPGMTLRFHGVKGTITTNNTEDGQ